MTPYSKPYLTLDQQVALLVSRGMSISDTEKAKTCLARIGYYRLSAYWHPFRKSTTAPDPATGKAITLILDDFKEETDFATVLDLYVYDKNIRLLVMDALERIEIAVRTHIALLLGQKDTKAHRNPKLLHGNFARRPKNAGNSNTRHQEWLRRQDNKFLDSRDEFVKHFKSKYAGENLPIWMDVELWDFGSLSHFFGGLNVKDQDYIASLYNVSDGQVFKTWIHCLNDIRNICAHHSRLWNKPLVNQPIWPKTGALREFDHIAQDGDSQRRLYAALAIMTWLIRYINPTSTWRDRLVAKIDLLPTSKHISLQSAGFPVSWKNEALWK